MNKINYFFTAITVCLSSICSAQLIGNYTVGTDASNYPTLTSAVAALQANGVGAGGVNLIIAPGTYQENIVLQSITGLSATSPLTITGTPGTVKFQGTGTNASSDAIFQINALSYVNLNGIDISDISTAGNDAEFGIYFLGSATAGCRFNTVTNCTILLGPNGVRPSSSTRGIVFKSTASSAAAANNNNVIDKVKIDNSSWGIQFSCSANFFGTISQPDFNNAVTNSTFGSILPLGHDFSSGALAINALGGRNMLIENNIIAAISNLNSSPGLPVSTVGISLDSCSGIVRSNTIKNIEYQGTIGSVFGIRSSTFLGDETLIANNAISNLKRSDFVASTTDPSLTITGIWIFNQSGNNGLAKILNNSIYLDGSSSVSYSSGGINLSGGSTGKFPADVYNNIVVNNISTSSSSYRSFALVDGNTNRGYLRSNYNILYANGTNGYLGAIGRELGGSEQFTNDLAVFRAFSLTDLDSKNFSPTFTDANMGDLSIPATAINPTNYLVPTLPAVPLDITGRTRTTPSTFAGAYEKAIILAVNNSGKYELSIYPNPVTDVLKIANFSGEKINDISIFNMAGQMVMTLGKNLNSEVGTTEFNVSNLKTGIYILKLKGSQGTVNKKFLKK